MSVPSESQTLIPQSAASILKCSLCKKYLSVPPVFTSNYVEEKYKCGRCNYLSVDTSMVRAKVYEKLAQFMLFPCVNIKCKEKLPWGTVLQHEKICPFRTIVCPSDDCMKLIELEKIVPHFSLYHLEYKKINFLEVANASLRTENFAVFLIVKSIERPFLFFQYTKDGYIWFSVFCFNEDDVNNTFEITLVSKNGSFTVSKQIIVLFNNEEHCINCMIKPCIVDTHKYSKSKSIAPYGNNQEVYNAIMTTKLENETVIKILGSDSIDYTINIVDDSEQRPKSKKAKMKTRSNKKEDAIKEENETRESIDKALMENIECPVCSSLMSSPIYLCLTGHSLCERCLSRLQNCPFCQAKFVNSRNYALEKIAEIFKITQPNRPKQKL